MEAIVSEMVRGKALVASWVFASPVDGFGDGSAGVIVACAAMGLLVGLCAFWAMPEGGGGREGRSERGCVPAIASMLGGALRGTGVDAGPISVAARELGDLVDHAAASGRGGTLVRVVDGADALGLLALVVGCGGVLGAVASLSALGAFVGAVVPVAMLAVRAAARARDKGRRVEAAMADAFGALAVALGSGHSLGQAMRFVGGHAPEPVRTEFMRVSFCIDCGVPVSEALDAMLARLPAPGLDLVALALKVSQRTGAPLAGLLSDAAGLVRVRLELKRMLDVKTSQARMSARMVAGMPVAMIAVLTVLSEDFRHGIAMPAGAASIAISLTLNAIAWMIIGRIMKVEL